MWLEFITDSKSQFAQTDFDPKVVQNSDPRPKIGLHQKWNNFNCLDQDSHCSRLYSQNSETEERITKEDEETFEDYFLYIPRGIPF